MRKERRFFEGFDSCSNKDYKQAFVENETRNNFESINNWLYLGTDILDPSFVKVGITTGDLSSRSYSSARPSYYIFCAFKFKYNISRNEMENIEHDILNQMEKIYCYNPYCATRLLHFDSRQVSECFYPVNFFNFYKDLHFQIYDNHRESFVISGYEDYGEFVDCIFNPRRVNSDSDLKPMDMIEMIVQSY